jgi:hypothetical protein
MQMTFPPGMVSESFSALFQKVVQFKGVDLDSHVKFDLFRDISILLQK